MLHRIVSIVFLLFFACNTYGQLIIDTPAVDFGKVAVDATSPSITVNLVNQGAEPITVNCAGGAPFEPQFGSSQGCAGLTLNQGESCPRNFSFTPDALGVFTGSSNPNCNGIPLSISLKGEGVLPALHIDTPAVDFGSVLVNTTSPIVTVDLINKGPDPVTISCAGGAPFETQFGSSQGCAGLTLNQGESCPRNFSFTPDATAFFTGSSNPSCNGVPLSINLSGTGVNAIPAAELVIDTPIVDFGKIAVGVTSPTVTVNLVNQGTDPIVVGCAGGAPFEPQFGSSQGCAGVTLNPGESCPRNFTFTPDAVGDFSGSSNPNCNGFPLSIGLQGEGVLPSLHIDRPAIDFGIVPVGTSSPTVTVLLFNRGPDPVTISCAGGAPFEDQFSSSQGCAGLTLNAGESCPRNFTFNPTRVGLVTGSSNPNCNGVPLSISLRGVGDQLRSRATFAVTKEFTDGNPNDVEVKLNCNTGLPLQQSTMISPFEDVNFIVQDFNDGEMDCTVTESEVQSYGAEYFDGNETAPDGCQFDDVEFETEYMCEITNAPLPVTVEVDKEWIAEGPGLDAVNLNYEIELTCQSEILEGYFDGSAWHLNWLGFGGDTFAAQVIPMYPSTTCSVSEVVFDSAVEVENGCGTFEVSAGNGHACTITNTVFFEGIPTLSNRSKLVLFLLILASAYLVTRRTV